MPISERFILILIIFQLSRRCPLRCRPLAPNGGRLCEVAGGGEALITRNFAKPEMHEVPQGGVHLRWSLPPMRRKPEGISAHHINIRIFSVHFEI